MNYTVELPKILYLILIISKHAKKAVYYNTNDLIKIANELKPELVRLRQDKNDYKFFDDTNFGGLRGNFSTILTLRGFIKKNNAYTPYYGIGRTDRLFNAVNNGDIILENFSAHTLKPALKNLLEIEAKNFKIREDQAHIKAFLKKNPNFILKRDNDNFPKLAALKSDNDKYFLRILFNTFINENVVEFNMLSYIQGAKAKKFNIHPLFVIPSYDNSWDEFYILDSKDILTKPNLFIYFNKKDKKFYDSNGNIYKHYSLEDGIKTLSGQDGNIAERLNYDWDSVRDNLIEDSTAFEGEVKQDEFSIFLEKFLNWDKKFSIQGKDVVDLTVSSSGGADVILKFSGGTTQKLELEHNWNNYISHGHHKCLAWENAWLFADEKWDFEKIKKIFTPHIHKNLNCIPKIFLCTNELTHNKEAYFVNWNELTYNKIL